MTLEVFNKETVGGYGVELAVSSGTYTRVRAIQVTSSANVTINQDGKSNRATTPQTITLVSPQIVMGDFTSVTVNSGIVNIYYQI